MQQMALGKCVVAARVPSLVDYIEDGKTAILYEPRNVEDLADKMQMILENGEMNKKIGYNGQRVLCEECNEQRMALEIEKQFCGI